MDNNIINSLEITNREKQSYERKEIELKPIEFKNQRIITTKQLAYMYDTDTNNIKNNFANHSDKFIEGKHFFKLTGDDLKKFKLQVNDIDLQISNMARSLILWTERGALHHAKILDTDLAWEAYENLEETYFKVRDSFPSNISKELQAIFMLDGKTEELKNKITGVRKDFEDFKDNAPLFNSECDELMDLVKSIATKSLGGYKSPAYNDKSLRSKIYSDIQQQLRREFGVRKYKYIKRNQLSKAKDILTNYSAPTVLIEEIEIVNNQVSLEECCCTK